MTQDSLRVDRWLWFARFFKSRTTAAKLCASGRVRINGDPVDKAHHAVRVGDVLTFPQGREIRVIEIRALGQRRGPAPEAQTLYADLQPPLPRGGEGSAKADTGRRERGAGRPTKADRRAIDRLRGDME